MLFRSIHDFEVGSFGDIINFVPLLSSLGYDSNNPLSDEIVILEQMGSDIEIKVKDPEIDDYFTLAILKNVNGREWTQQNFLPIGTDPVYLIGTELSEIFISGSGDDVIDGRAGDDKFMSGSGNDELQGGIGNDTFVFDGNLTSDDIVDGGVGYDILFAHSLWNNNSLDGIINFEKLVLGDTLTNVVTQDSLVGDSETFTVDATLIITGDDEGPLLPTDLGGSALTWDGSAETNGSFQILGSALNDTIITGSGADTIVAGDGDDTIVTNGGADTIILEKNLTSSDTIDGGEGLDELQFTDSNAASNDLDGVSNVETITLGNSATSVTTKDSQIGRAHV